MRTTGAELLRLGEHWARVERLQALEACKGPHVIWGVSRERERGVEGKGEGEGDMKERRPGARVQSEKKREGTRVRGHGRDGLVRKQRILSAHVSTAHASSLHKALAHTNCVRETAAAPFQSQALHEELQSLRVLLFRAPAARN